MALCLVGLSLERSKPTICILNLLALRLSLCEQVRCEIFGFECIAGSLKKVVCSEVACIQY